MIQASEAALLTLLYLSAITLALDPVSARDVAGPAADQPRTKVAPSASPAGDEKRGEGLYNVSCVVCHGAGATGGIGPRLAGNRVLASQHAFDKVLSEGRHMMPPLKDALTPQQLADIHAWLKSLR